MKKIILCLLVAATAAACSKDETTVPGVNPGNLVLTFGAGTSDTEADPEATSVRAGYDGVNSVWYSGDAVGLTLDNVNNNNLQFTEVSGSLSSDSRRVQFTGTLKQPVTGAVTSIVYHPYSATATVANSTVTTIFPASQTYVATGYKGIPLFSKYTGDIKALTHNFNNLFSVVKLTLNKGVALTGTVKLQKVIFQGNNNETVSGTMSVNMSGATPVVSYPGSGKTVTLDLGAGVELTTANQTFYIAVPAIDYTKGYSFTFVTDQGQVTRSAKNSGANYAKNTIYAAPALTISSLSVVSIPDGNLRNALKNLGLISILDPVNNIVSLTAAGLQATSIDVSGKEISNLTGINLFPALVSLNASDNSITTVDVSKLTLLTNLDLSKNDLTSLNLTGNTKLLTLNLASNQLTTLNVSANTALTTLNVSSNKLTTLSVSANTLLTSLNVASNRLTSLDLRSNTLLTTVRVYGNSLATLNISGLTLLGALYLDASSTSTNAINALTLTVPVNATVQNLVANSMPTSLWTSLVCLNNATIRTISVNGNVKLLSATVTGNTNLTSLDVSGNALQTTLKVYGSTLATLNISGTVVLSTLQLDSSGTNCISGLKLTIPVAAAVQNLIADAASAAVNWTSFNCTANPNILSISLQNNVLVTAVTAKNNPKLTSLNVKGCTLLTVLGIVDTGNATGFVRTGPL